MPATQIKSPSKFIGLREAADITGWSLSTLRHWASQGRLDPNVAVKQGRNWKLRREPVESNGITPLSTKV